MKNHPPSTIHHPPSPGGFGATGQPSFALPRGQATEGKPSTHWPTLILLFGVLFLFQLGAITLIDYDESCYAQAAREMDAAGEWLVPTVNGEPFFEKPPLLYWSQIASYRLFGVTPFAARLPNALAGLATVLALYAFARRPLGARTAWRAAFILGSNLLFMYLARVALTDMLLTLSFVLCLGFAFQAVEQAERARGRAAGLFLAACLCAALGMLAKGAIGALLPAAAGGVYLILQRRLKLLLRPAWLLPGLLILLGVGLSWYVLLGFTQPDGFGFMGKLFMEHHVGRFTSPMDKHPGPFYYFVPVILLGFLPWSVFLPLAVWGKVGSRTLLRPDASRPPASRDARGFEGQASEVGSEETGGDDSDDGAGRRFLQLFVLFAAITFVFFSIAATKLPSYVLPCLPGLALLVAALFARGRPPNSVFDVRCSVFDVQAQPVSSPQVKPGAADNAYDNAYDKVCDKVRSDSQLEGQRGSCRAWTWTIGTTAGLLGLLALLVAVVSVVLPRLPGWLGEDALKAPGLAEPPRLGAMPAVAAIMLLVAAVGLVVAWRRKGPAGMFPATAASAVALCAVAFWLIVPVYDAHFLRPLTRVAEQAAALTPPHGRILLVKLNMRPSINFHGERRTLYCRYRESSRLLRLLAGPDSPVGITTKYYYNRMHDEYGLPIRLIAEDTGYVVFGRR